MRTYENALEHLRNNPRAVANFVEAIDDRDVEVVAATFRFLASLVDEAGWVVAAGLRLEGRSWEAVGRALGVSKQAAWEMYAPEMRARGIDVGE